MDFEEECRIISDKMDMKNIPDATHHKVQINDMPIVKPELKVAVDQLIMLYKSELSTLVIETLNNLMETYYDLPADKQVKEIPERVKYYTDIRNWLEGCAEAYEKYQKPSRKPMLINDDKLDITDKTHTTYDFLENFDDNVDMIIHDDLKAEIKESKDDLDFDFDFDDDIVSESLPEQKPESLPETIQSDNPRDIFMKLKNKYRKNRSISQLKFNSSKGIIANIYSDEKAWNDERERLRKQSVINWNSQRIYNAEGGFPIYIIRHRQ